MAETDESGAPAAPTPRRGMGMKGWLATMAAALALGGGAFYAMYSGMADPVLHADASDADREGPAEAVPQFLELDPLMVTVGGAGSIRQLRFRAFLQVGPEASGSVAPLQPRILDILATYLRAVSVDRLEDPTALLKLRAQLLRRIQLLAGADAVTDLLIIDFVIT